MERAHALASRVYRSFGLLGRALPFIKSPYVTVSKPGGEMIASMSLQHSRKMLNCERIMKIDLRDHLPVNYSRDRIIEAGRLGLCNYQPRALRHLAWYALQLGNCCYQEAAGMQGWVCISAGGSLVALRRLGLQLHELKIQLKPEVHDELEVLSPVFFDRNNFPSLYLIDCKQMRSALNQRADYLSKLDIDYDSLTDSNVQEQY